jgi:hypothetical protein
MATSFKTLDPRDIVSTRNLLHEAIPITGTIVSGTYADANIKNFSHGLFQSVYDYPYLSSSANHILDLTVGYANASGLSSSTNTQNAKKINIYNEMAQVLAGFDEFSNVRRFDEDGDLTGGTKINEAFFINFTRLLAKDEVKKGSFTLTLDVGEGYSSTGSTARNTKTINLTDKSGSSGFKVNSPAGEYGILYATGSAMEGIEEQGRPFGPSGYVAAGLIYYQAGIAVVTASVFGRLLDNPCSMSFDYGRDGKGAPVPPHENLLSIDGMLTASAISGGCDNIRHRIDNIQFNNTTELNSTVYFCRANHNDFNYSANPTYLTASKIVVKNNSTDSPVSYATTVGLYSADNELLAVAKLSEPLKKDPSTEFTLRVRLDY